MYSGYEPKFLIIAPVSFTSFITRLNFLSLMWPSQSIKKSWEFMLPLDGRVSILLRFIFLFSKGFKTDITNGKDISKMSEEYMKYFGLTPDNHKTTNPLKPIKIDVPKSGWLTTNKMGKIKMTIGTIKFLKLLTK